MSVSRIRLVYPIEILSRRETERSRSKREEDNEGVLDFVCVCVCVGFLNSKIFFYGD